MESNIALAKVYHNKEKLRKIAPNHGYYKWWCKREELDVLLDALMLEFCNIEKYLEKMQYGEESYYCVYMGIAVKESIASRLNWHINQRNNYTNVKNGILSTFRVSITSIVGSDIYDCIAANEFIDKMLVEYYFSEFPIKSIEAKEQITAIEKAYLSSDKLYILNVKENRHPLAPVKKLKELRHEKLKGACPKTASNAPYTELSGGEELLLERYRSFDKNNRIIIDTISKFLTNAHYTELTENERLLLELYRKLDEKSKMIIDTMMKKLQN